MRRRRRQHAAELTPLIDVLFIVLFAALIQARVAMERAPAARTPIDAAPTDAAPADAGPTDAAPADAGPSDAGSRDAAPDAQSAHLARALAVAGEVARAAKHRDVFIVELDRDGVITAMSRWRDGQELRRDLMRERLLRSVLPVESGLEVVYRSAADPSLRICPLVRARFAPDAPDLAQALVLVVVDAPRAELPLALDHALEAYVRDCFGQAGGVAILFDPEDDHDQR